MSDERPPPPTPSRSPWPAIATFGVLILCVWGTVFVVVPMQKKRFDEFGLQLPWLTKFIIDIAYHLAGFAIALVPGSLLAWAGLTGLTASEMIPRRVARMLAYVGAILALSLLLVFAFGLSLPAIKLAEGSAK